MNERSAFKNVLIKMVVVIIFAVLYCLGGAEFGPGKWIRRFVAPLFLCGGMFYFSRDWRSLAQMPLMMGSLCLGYGGDDLWIKVAKRGIYGLANGISSGLSDLLSQRVWLGIFQTVIVTGSIIYLGVFNPLPDARTEEFVIGLLIAFIPMMSARRRVV